MPALPLSHTHARPRWTPTATPAVAALHRNSKAARAGLDRTKYTCPRPISYYTHHSQRISLGITKEDARATHGETSKRKADLTRLIGAVGARM